MSIVSEIHELKNLDVALFGLNMMLCKMSLNTNLFLAEPTSCSRKDRFHPLRMGADQKAEPIPLTST